MKRDATEHAHREPIMLLRMRTVNHEFSIRMRAVNRAFIKQQ
jgi:hypothetical protein